MEMSLLIGVAITAVWFAVLIRRPRSPRKPDADGLAVDPALTKALDDSLAEHVRFKGFP